MRKPWVVMACLACLMPAFPKAETGNTYFVVVGGLGGEAGYEESFATYVGELEELCTATAGDASRVHAIFGRSATRRALSDLFDKLTRESGPSDSLAVFLIGHGSYDGRDYKFNLPGPDLSASELRRLLDATPARRQLVVITTSSAGASLETLKSEGRVVIAATKSGRERNSTVFAGFWVEALRDPAADSDKNEAITALEAFQYAQRKVKDYYEKGKQLATEHPRLQGDAAASFTVARLGKSLQAADDPALRTLFAAREKIERKISEVKAKKDSMSEEEYYSTLEKLFVGLAQTQNAIEETIENR